jgi:hypothetical protein
LLSLLEMQRHCEPARNATSLLSLLEMQRHCERSVASPYGMSRVNLPIVSIYSVQQQKTALSDGFRIFQHINFGFQGHWILNTCM